MLATMTNTKETGSRTAACRPLIFQANYRMPLMPHA